MRKAVLVLIFLLSFYSVCAAAIFTDTAEKQEEYTLVNDFAATMTKEQSDAMEKDLRFVAKNQKKDGLQTRFYYFSTDASRGGLKEAEKTLLGNARIEATIAPILFIYDKSAKKSAIVVDERLETYVSRQYVQSLFEKRSESLEPKDIHEISMRMASVVALLMENGMNRQTAVPSKEEIKANVELKYASFTQNVKKQEQEKTETKKEEKEKSSIPEIAIFLSGIVTVVVFYKKLVARAKEKKKKPA